MNTFSACLHIETRRIATPVKRKPLTASLFEMREAGEMVDVHLEFDGLRVPCHKVILAGSCEYFERMFLSNMRESTAKEVSIKGISSTIGLLVVDYLYFRTVDITGDNAQGLLEASSMLLLDELKHKVEEFLVRQIEAQSCVSLLNLARLFELKALIEALLKFLTDNLDKAFDEIEMKELREEDLVHVLKNHASQRVCFCALQKWVRCTGGDADQFMALLQHVDLSRCSKQFIEDIVKHEEMMNSPRGSQIIKMAMHSTSLIAGDYHKNIWVARPNVEKYWKRIQSPLIATHFYSECICPEGLICSGGWFDGNPKDECVLYCTREMEWSTLPPMTNARYAHSSIYYNDLLCLIGGRILSGQPTDSVEALDNRTMEWRPLASLPVRVYLCIVVCVSNRLFVLGGAESKQVSSRNVYEYCASPEMWQRRAPMPEDCHGASGIELRDKIFVVGGIRKSCLMYDPRDDCWSMLQRPQALHFLGAILSVVSSNHDEVVLIGGQGCVEVEAFCPDTDRWSNWDWKLPFPGCLSFLTKVQ